MKTLLFILGVLVILFALFSTYCMIAWCNYDRKNRIKSKIFIKSCFFNVSLFAIGGGLIYISVH